MYFLYFALGQYSVKYQHFEGHQTCILGTMATIFYFTQKTIIYLNKLLKLNFGPNSRFKKKQFFWGDIYEKVDLHFEGQV